MSPPLLAGLVAAPFTPFQPDGQLNLELIPRLCDRLVANRVAAAFVCGTTGEGTSLTDEERRQVAEAWVAAAAGRIKVVVHVGHLAGASAAALAQHAQAAGADAVASCAPSFFPISNVAQLTAIVAQTARGAPNLPFYFYHIPAFTRLDLSMVEFLERARDAIPTLRGIKFTHNDFEECLRLIRFDGGRYEILSGREQMLLAALASGTRGAVGSNFNFAAPLYHAIWEKFESGHLDEARALQAEAAELTAVLRRSGGMRAMKALMGWQGLPCGQPRAPIIPLTAAELESLRAELLRWQSRAGSAWIGLE